MSGINKVILVGYIGKDLKIRYLDGNVSVTSFPLATTEFHINKEGKKIEQTEWHNIVMWRGLADVAVKFLSKGKLVYIEGKLRTRIYEDKEGVRKQITEIIGESFHLLGRKTENINQDVAKPEVEAAGSLNSTEGENYFSFDDLSDNIDV